MVAVKCQLYSGGTINYNCFNEKQFWIFWWFMIWFFFVLSMHVCQSECVQIDNRMWLHPGMPLLLSLSNRYNKNVYFFPLRCFTLSFLPSKIDPQLPLVYKISFYIQLPLIKGLTKNSIHTITLQLIWMNEHPWKYVQIAC